MSFRRSIPALALIIGALLPACLQDPWSGTAPLDSDILFNISEAHVSPDTDPVLVIRMATRKTYGCYNVAIMNRLLVDGRRVQVTLYGLATPEICLTAIGPATAGRRLDLRQGDYRLAFFHAGDADVYDLRLTRDAISIVPRDTTFTSTDRTLSWRYPPNTFAYVCGTYLDNEWIYDDFRDSLLAVPGIHPYVFPDSGYVPYPLAPTGYYINHPSLFFRYDDEADFTRAGEMLGRYAREVLVDEMGTNIYLSNWRARAYRSWMIL